MRYYKLIDPFDTSVYLNLPHKTSKGIKYEMLTMKPGKKYSEYIEDELFVKELLNATKKISYTPARKEALQKYGARFKEVKCGSCGGGVKKLEVHFAEVVE